MAPQRKSRIAAAQLSSHDEPGFSDPNMVHVKPERLAFGVVYETVSRLDGNDPLYEHRFKVELDTGVVVQLSRHFENGSFDHSPIAQLSLSLEGQGLFLEGFNLALVPNRSLDGEDRRTYTVGAGDLYVESSHRKRMLGLR